jgi:radical SAM superfamily enzyme with C-terminal helix-hairpin-helix motif
MEFWNDRIVDKSWNVLLALNKKYRFILIGGWASYLHTKSIKSKDIDIVIDFEILEEFKTRYDLKKNQHLKKYEIVIDEISVDIYVPYFSDLPLPVDELKNYTVSIEGIDVLQSSVLLILKQGAEKDRYHSVKGQKDRVDILNILINGDIDLKQYSTLLHKYGLKDYKKRLIDLVKNAEKEFFYLGIEDLRKRKLLKKKIVERLT